MLQNWIKSHIFLYHQQESELFEIQLVQITKTCDTFFKTGFLKSYWIKKWKLL